MASGLPIITTYTGGTIEMIRGNGLLIPKQSPDAIAKAIVELIGNSALRVQMGKRSREIAETLIWERVADDYLDLYDRTLASLGSAERVNVAYSK
jgi:glycosyltransferase involved in cell wall biosynthesis